MALLSDEDRQLAQQAGHEANSGPEALSSILPLFLLWRAQGNEVGHWLDTL